MIKSGRAPLVTLVRELASSTGSSRGSSTSGLGTLNGRHFRMKNLSEMLKVPQAQLLKHFALRQRGKIFIPMDGIWYQFPSVKEVIISHSVAKRYIEEFGAQNAAANKNKSTSSLGMLSSTLSMSLSDDGSWSRREITDRKRTPVVAILGHYNHGKTTLLDALGGTNICASESHGITQVIRTKSINIEAAFSKAVNGSGARSFQPRSQADAAALPITMPITFVDTPGQDIFYRMRNYGVSVADIALLVVSSAEGICPQTEESIGAAEALGMPIIVCLNKIDVPAVATDLKKRLAELEESVRDYVVLDKSIIVPISAKEGTNLDILQSKLIELVANSTDIVIPELALPSSSSPTAANKLLPPSSSSSSMDADDDSASTSSGKINESSSSESISGGRTGGRRYQRPKVTRTTALLHNNNSTCSSSSSSSSSNKGEEVVSAPIVEEWKGEGSISAKGIIVDITKSRQHGTMLQVVLRAGTVSVGDCFAAGGWSGKITRMFHDELQRKVDSAKAGWGVRVHITLHSTANDPRPLGDQVLFYSEKKATTAVPAVSAVERKPSRGKLVKAEDEAEVEADQNRMEYSLSSFAITEHEAKLFRLEKHWSIIKERKKTPKEGGSTTDTAYAAAEGVDGKFSEEGCVSEGEFSEYDEETAAADTADSENHSSKITAGEEHSAEDVEEEEDDDEEDHITKKIVFKANSEVALSTVIDSLEEALENLAQPPNESSSSTRADVPVRVNTNTTPVQRPMRVVSGGVGAVNIKDVTIAIAANAILATYNVDFETDASRLAQNRGLKLLSIDKLEDIVKMVTIGEVPSNMVPKAAKKKKTAKKSRN